MKLKKVLPITAMLLVALVSGCNKDAGTSSNLMSSDLSSSDLKAGGLSKGAVNLGTAGNFVILSESGITTTGTTAVTGDIGSGPIAATALTGFGLIMDATGTFSTSTLVAGKVYAADYTDPTPTMMTTAVGDMETAYTDAAGRISPTANLNLGSGGDIGGLTLAPGVYNFSGASGNVTISTDLTLSGGANDVWIFQVNGTLGISSAKSIILSGGALAQNVFWQVTGAVTLLPGSHFEGTILAKTNIALQAGAVLNGKALAQTAVTLDSNTITNTESKKECEGFLKAEKKAFDDGQKADKKAFELTDPTSAEKKAFEAQQKADKKAFEAQQKMDMEQCKALK